MVTRRLPDVPPPAVLPALPASTLPDLVAARRHHLAVTPRHRNIVDRADTVLGLFEEYQAEADFLGRPERQ